jgi:hypothetical protein
MGIVLCSKNLLIHHKIPLPTENQTVFLQEIKSLSLSQGIQIHMLMNVIFASF